MTGAAVPLPQRARPQLPGLRLLGDDRLARLAAAGNQQAFAEIYRRYHQPLYRYCLSIVRNPEDASDALQSTAAKAMGALLGEDRDIALKPWLYRIAHNESISILRRRHEHVSIEDVEPAARETPESNLAVREQLQELVADLGELSERQRGALIMRELNGLDYDEIADVFSVSAAAAKQTVYEARTALHDRAQGREMDCAEIRRALSDGDRRVARGRRIRAHVKGCAGCRDFELLMGRRPAELAALAPPLPAASAAAILNGVLGGGGASGGGGLIAAVTGGAVTDAGSKAVAIGAATLVAGAGVIGVVGGNVPGFAGEDGGGSSERAVDTRKAAGGAGHEARGRRDARDNAAARRREQRAERRERRERAQDRALRGGSGGGAAPRGEQDPGVPPSSRHVRPQSGPTGSAPAPVNNTLRRGGRLGETVQNVAGQTPVAVPDPPVDVPVDLP
jgi:RNA polymerase sigma factor (sigma-70 family)